MFEVDLPFPGWWDMLVPSRFNNHLVEKKSEITNIGGEDIVRRNLCFRSGTDVERDVSRVILRSDL